MILEKNWKIVFFADFLFNENTFYIENLVF